MKAWFTSLNGAVALSLIALISFLGRTFLDWRYVYQEFLAGVGPVALTTVVYLAFFGGWFWALLAAARRSRTGLVAALLFSLVLPVGLGVGTLASFCSSPCQTAWPLMEIANWSNLLFGLLAAVSAAVHLRQVRSG
ncbi:MAG TPA: hypothetical protein VI789_04565 [Dehalococcoidia bacterium]|nr:hypothetical protein [Dehalococcoidia bacterium]